MAIRYIIGFPNHDSVAEAPQQTIKRHMSHNLKLLKGGYIGDFIGDYHRGY